MFCLKKKNFSNTTLRWFISKVIKKKICRFYQFKCIHKQCGLRQKLNILFFSIISQMSTAPARPAPAPAPAQRAAPPAPVAAQPTSVGAPMASSGQPSMFQQMAATAGGVAVGSAIVSSKQKYSENWFHFNLKC